jgi:ABC-type anion transport system duplicated permease subunit
MAKTKKIEWKNYILLGAGILLIIVSAFVLAQANAKQAKCESLSGKIVQFLDSDTSKSCANVKTTFFLAYAGIAIGVGLVVAHFVRGRK